MLISDSYRKLNAKLHEDIPEYGVNGHRFAGIILDLVRMIDAKTILDYGCGKGSLVHTLRGELNPQGVKIYGYDPAVEEWRKPPTPADITVCSDVLEHVEPECLDFVLADIDRLTNKAVFLNISTRPAKKTLADGRNAHLIVESAEWWFKKLRHLGVLLYYTASDKECTLAFGRAL